MNELIEARTEVSRELTVRASVYPRLITQGKLTQNEADRRMRALRYVLYFLDRATADRNPFTPTTGE